MNSKDFGNSQRTGNNNDFSNTIDGIRRNMNNRSNSRDTITIKYFRYTRNKSYRSYIESTSESNAKMYIFWKQ